MSKNDRVQPKTEKTQIKVPSLCRKALLAENNSRLNHPYPTYNFIYEYGLEFTPIPLPSPIELGQPKQCFVNAEHVASRCPGYEYAEGYAFRRGFLFHHAWCVKDGIAIDPTLENIEGVSLIGIVIERPTYVAEMQKSESFSVLEPSGPNEVFFSDWAQLHPKIVPLPT